MRLHHLLGGLAACSLLAGAAYAQSSPASDPEASAPAAPATGAAPQTSTAPSAGAASSTDVTAAPPAQTSASAATSYGQGASVTVAMTTNGPVPDTKENRQKYGGPDSHAGKRTAAKGN